MKRYTVILFLFLSACGSQNSPQVHDSWNGGIYGYWDAVGEQKALIILHQGHAKFNAQTSHDGEWYDMASVAVTFSQNGYSVVGFEMPPLPHGGGVERFYKPVLDYIETVPKNIPIYMVGFSGGGWTTTVVTALSTRIIKGYSVQGDMPDNPTAERCKELSQFESSEYELCNPPLPYREMYKIAGSRLMHVYTINGGFPLSMISDTPDWPYVVDYTAINHSWTDWTTDYILGDIQVLLDSRHLD